MTNQKKWKTLFLVDKARKSTTCRTGNNITGLHAFFQSYHKRVSSKQNKKLTKKLFPFQINSSFHAQSQHLLFSYISLLQVPKDLQVLQAMAKVLVLFYSMYGHNVAMANAVVEGVVSAGSTADLRRIPETLPEEVLA
ncbi:Hypothetical protein, putative, partial [Bodo saltans]